MKNIEQINVSLNKIQELISLGEGKISSDVEAIVVIGDTGEGKSTLINYLAGNKLHAEMIGYPPKYVIKAEEQLGDIKISDKTVSETTVPNKWSDGEVIYWDCPGFGDTKGVEQDAANAFYIKKLFDNIENVKIVLVVSENTLGEARASKFLNLIKQLGNLFIDVNSLKDSLSLVITKATTNDVNITKEHLSKIAHDHDELLNKDGNNGQKLLLEFLAGSDSKIEFFKSPVKSEIDLSHAVAIKDMISSTKYLHKPPIQITVSEGTTNALESIAKGINKHISDIFKDINRDLLNVSKEILDNGNSSTQVKSLLEDLVLGGIKSLNKSSSEERLLVNYKILISQLISNQLNIIDRSSALSHNLDFLDFIHKFNEDISDGVDAWKQKLTVADFVSKLIHEPSVDFNEQKKVLQLKGQIIGSTEIMKGIRGNSDQEIQSVNVFSYNKLYLDKNVELNGKNLNIFASHWKVGDNIKIDLSGLAGENYKESAPKSDGYKDNGSGKNGNDGLPGKPGNPGGNFYGYGEKIINDGALIIDVSGGNGGSGQNGGDGADGMEGADGNLDAINAKDQSVLLSRKKFTFRDKEALSKGFHIIKTVGTFNSQMLETYESKGEKAKNGGDAGAGGKGGLGALAGKINMEYGGIKSVKFILDTGQDGDNGSVGKVGKGGKHGVIYRGQYIDETVFTVFRENGKEFDKTSVLNASSTAITQLGTGVVVNQCANEFVTGATLKCVTKGGQHIAQELGGEAIQQVVFSTAKEGTKELIKGSTWVVQEAGTKVLEEVMIQVGKEGAKEVSQTLSKEAALETMKKVAFEGTKTFGKEVVKDGAGIAVEQAVIQGSKGFWGTVGGFAASMGVSLAIQTGLSITSAYTSSGWKIEPKAFEDNGYADNGLLPTQLNDRNQEKSKELVWNLDIDTLKQQFADDTNSFINVIGDEAATIFFE